MSERSPHSFAYRPALDGLRAFAVLAVIAYHLEFGWARGGYLGVDAFFVLSGYLITSLLLGEHHSRGRVQLSAFWARRARRLLPAVLLLVLAVALYAVTWADPLQYDRLRYDGWATLAYVANWRLIASGQSYFDLFSAPSPLRHMWSLAIEEQFYVLWPLIVFGTLVLARGRRTLLTIVTVTGIAASAIWMAVHYDAANPSRVYYGTDTRAHSLLVGCLLALVLEHRSEIAQRVRVPLQVLGVAGMVVLLLMVHAVSDTDEHMYRGGFLVYAVVVAVVIAAAVQTTWSPLRSVLSWKPLLWIGAISYGLYLWHWAAIAILTPERVHVHGNVLKLVQVAATFAVAILSFYFVERPIRYGTMPNRAVLASAPVAIVVVGIVLAGATIDAAKVDPQFDATAKPTAPPPPPSTATTVPPTTNVPGETTTTLPVAQRPMTVLVVGDSVAGTVAWGLESAAEGTPVRVVSAAFAGCGLASGIALDQNDQPFSWSRPCYDNVPGVLEKTVGEQHPNVVVWLSTWELSDRLDPATNQVLKLGTPAHDRALLAQMDEQVQRLTRDGARVVLLTATPRAPSDENGRPADGQDGRYAHYNALLRRFASEHRANVSLVNTMPLVCPSGVPCEKEVQGVVLRPDGGHFTHETAPIIGKWLLPKLQQYAPPA